MPYQDDPRQAQRGGGLLAPGNWLQVCIYVPPQSFITSWCPIKLRPLFMPLYSSIRPSFEALSVSQDPISNVFLEMFSS